MMIMTITITATIPPITPPTIAPILLLPLSLSVSLSVLLSLLPPLSPVLGDGAIVNAAIIVVVDNADDGVAVVVAAASTPVDNEMLPVVPAVTDVVDAGIIWGIVVGFDEGIVVDAAAVTGDIDKDNGTGNT